MSSGWGSSGCSRWTSPARRTDPLGTYDSGREEAGNPRVSGEKLGPSFGLDPHRSLAARRKLPQDGGVGRATGRASASSTTAAIPAGSSAATRQRCDHPAGRGAEGGDLHSHLDEDRRPAAPAWRRQRARRIDADGCGAAWPSDFPTCRSSAATPAATGSWECAPSGRHENVYIEFSGSDPHSGQVDYTVRRAGSRPTGLGRARPVAFVFDRTLESPRRRPDPRPAAANLRRETARLAAPIFRQKGVQPQVDPNKNRCGYFIWLIKGKEVADVSRMADNTGHDLSRRQSPPAVIIILGFLVAGSLFVAAMLGARGPWKPKDLVATL